MARYIEGNRVFFPKEGLGAIQCDGETSVMGDTFLGSGVDDVGRFG